MDLQNVRKIYFIGIGGIAMSAAAGLAQEQGYEVMGSDAATVYPPAKTVLEEHGIHVLSGYSRDQVASSGADLYVVSAGESAQNPEVAWLIEEDIPFISFPELLYALSQDKLRIVVAGTHGKSTTSGWLGHALREIDDSSYMVGAVLKDYNANFYSGTGHYIVFEGDEYKATVDDPTPKMHYYKGDMLVLTNLEFDHPDVFANLDEIKTEFRELVANVPDDGLIIYNGDNADLADVVYRETGRSFTFGIQHSAHMQATEILYHGGGSTFAVVNRLDPENIRTERYEIALPGEINIYNALAVITTLRALGFQQELVQRHLLTYSGVKRRFEIIYPLSSPPNIGGVGLSDEVLAKLEGGITVVDDYAHHPTAVRETLVAAKTRFPHARVWAIFEPHTYSRTKATLPELVASFDAADQVLLAHIYGAREHQNNAGITDSEVLSAVAAHYTHIRPVATKQEALAILEQELAPGDVAIVMAVGSFNRLAYELAEWLKNSGK